MTQPFFVTCAFLFCLLGSELSGSIAMVDSGSLSEQLTNRFPVISESYVCLAQPRSGVTIILAFSLGHGLQIFQTQGVYSNVYKQFETLTSMVSY